MPIGPLPPNALSIAQPGIDAAKNFGNKLMGRSVVKPKGVDGINGFLFDYAGEVRAERSADITDHYAEDATVINDHIALRPVRLVMRGLVAELVQTKAAANGIFGAVQNALTTVPAYLGKYTPGALSKVQGAITQAQNIEAQINDALAKGQSVLNFFKKSAPTKTRQEKAYAQLEAMQESRQIFTVVTPFKLFDNMVIEGLIFVQPEESKMLSDVTVTLKQMRFAEVIATPNYLSTFGGRAAFMNQAQSNVGKTPGTAVPNSIAFDLFSGGKQ